MKRFFIGVCTATMLSPLGAPTLARAESPKILQFQVQEVNQKTYFHLRVRNSRIFGGSACTTVGAVQGSVTAATRNMSLDFM